MSAEKVKAMPREQPVCGVYLLFKNDEVVYVGQSRNVYLRVVKHRDRRVGDFDSYTVIPCSESEMRMVEAYYIDLFKPPLNVVLPKFYRDRDGREFLGALVRELVQKPKKCGAEGEPTSGDREPPP